MSIWDNEETEPWDKNVPADLIPAIKHLRDSFDKTHSMCGLLVTMPLCYSQLHNGAHKSGFDDISEYIKALAQLKSRIAPPATQRLHDLLTQGTLPAIFKGFFDFYLEGVKVQALFAFHELLGIGRANEKRLNCPHIEWAELQTRHLIRSQRHCIGLWVTDVCDEHPYDPNEDADEQIFRWKWQAPAFLIMKPSLYGPYDAAKIWDRRDAESSLGLLEVFADRYVRNLESAVRDAAGDVALELAKQPKPAQNSSTDCDSQRIEPAHATATTRPKSTAKALTVHEQMRRRVIFAAISMNDEGLKYCKTLDEQKLAIPADWSQKGCPKTYTDAYRTGQPWQKRIQDEKSRYKKKYDQTPVAEREKLLQ